MSQYIFVTIRQAKMSLGLKALIAAGIGYAVLAELNRRALEEKINQLKLKLDKLEHGEGE